MNSTADPPRPAEQPNRVAPAGNNDVSTAEDSAEERYRRLVDHSPDAICVHAEGRVVYTNPAGVRRIGAPSAEHLVGRLITDFVHPDSIVPMLFRIAALKNPGDSSEPSEAAMMCLDGTSVPAEVVSVLTVWNGKPAYQVVFRELTTQKAAEATLRYQAALVTHVSDAIIATTLSGIVTSWNPAAAAIYDRPAARALALPVSEAVGADLDPAAIVAAGGVANCVHRRLNGGAPLSVRVSAATMENGFVLVCSDQTALRRAEQQFQTVVASLDEGVVVLDPQFGPEFVNPAALRMFGLPQDGLVAQYGHRIFTYPMCDAQGNPLRDDERPIMKLMMTGVPIQKKVFGVDRPDGQRLWLSMSCGLLNPDAPQHSSLLISFTDITTSHNASIQLAYRATHDGLTGLPNRSHAEARVSQALRSDATPPLAAVLFIDLDNLKVVNDELGHQAGDTLLKVAAERLRAGLRSEDFVARLGGDEFVALLFGSTDRTVLEQLSIRLHDALGAPFEVTGIRKSITASIGVTEVVAGDHRGAADILRDADLAMYRAKATKGRTCYA